MAVVKGTVEIGYEYALKTPRPIDVRTVVYKKTQLIDASKWSYGEEFYRGLPVWVSGVDFVTGEVVDTSANVGLYILTDMKGASVNLVSDPEHAEETVVNAAYACWTKMPSKEYVDELVKKLGSVLRFIDVLEPTEQLNTIEKAVADYRTRRPDYTTRVGDVFIFGYKEYVCTKYTTNPPEEEWKEFGDESLIITDIDGYSGSVTLDGSTTTDGSIRLSIDPSTGKITGTVYGYENKIENVGTGKENHISVFDASGYVKDSSVVISKTFSDSSYILPTGHAVKTELNKKTDKLTADASSHVAIYDTSGNLADSSTIISTTFIDSSFVLPTGHAIQTELDKKADKVANATKDNFASLDASGNLLDSGKSLVNNDEIGKLVFSVTEDGSTRRFAIEREEILAPNAPTITGEASFYNSENITMTGAAGTTLRYNMTTDGSEPAKPTAKSGTLVNGNTKTLTIGTLDVSTRTYKIRVVAVKNGEASPDASGTFVCTRRIVPVTFSVAAGTYNETKDVSLNCSTDGATIRYTLDGSDVSEGSSTYSSALSVAVSKTIKAKAFKTDWVASVQTSAEYELKVPTPSISVETGTDDYSLSRKVTITCGTADTIYYTTNGTTPTTDSSTIASGSYITLDTQGTYSVWALGVKAGWTNSSIAKNNNIVVAKNKCYIGQRDTAPTSVSDILGMEDLQSYKLDTLVNYTTPVIDFGLPAKYVWFCIPNTAALNLAIKGNTFDLPLNNAGGFVVPSQNGVYRVWRSEATLKETYSFEIKKKTT